ncbi:hypothetical protein AJ79_08532 [Helicocarpus griseus UAMH5409]|uniref:Uncharacterized protein n=1 Tax=Helicocarpus griseus UAMH5409 TaxID=1447875 RepID=A0A2B7WS48_9EURO|nr:hypothetical protein AJ79_08532 [Helicocarpus griseus UAMH5409]
MALQSNDRVLWLCLGVTLFFAVRGIAAELHRVRELTSIKKGEKDDQVIGEGTEDVSRSSVSSRLKDLPTYTALVNCLCNFLPEHKEEENNGNNSGSPILPKTRPQGERKALNTLDIILRENIPAALEAGVISRWLSRYPFPCVTQDESKRADVVLLTKTMYTDDSVMSSIISTLSSHQEGINQLRKYGLMGSRMEEHTRSIYDDGGGDYDDDGEEDDSDSSSDIWMVGGEDTAGLLPWTGGRRRQEGTAEEQALRRRRREAMVFSEGGRPLGRDDIIQPVQNTEDEELDAELEQLADEVDQELREEQLEAERQEQPRRSWPMWPF